MHPLHAWVMSLMVMLQPSAPWRDTYDRTAYAIEDAARVAPLPGEADREARVVETVAELVAVTYFESHFDPIAVGDHGQSLGLAQIGVSNLTALGLNRSQLLEPEWNLYAAAEFLKQSHRTCRGRPPDEQLAAYATGRGLCRVPEGVRASKNRIRKARALLLARPPFWTESSGAGSS